jgi:hypothetical protein
MPTFDELQQTIKDKPLTVDTAKLEDLALRLAHGWGAQVEETARLTGVPVGLLAAVALIEGAISSSAPTSQSAPAPAAPAPAPTTVGDAPAGSPPPPPTLPPSSTWTPAQG